MYIRDSTQIGNKMKQKYTKETRNIKHANYIKKQERQRTTYPNTTQQK